MKVSEAIEVLKNLNPNMEVKLTFEESTNTTVHHDYGCDHPCGGRCESQSERLGR